MKMSHSGWYNTSNVDNHGWDCGYCGRRVGGDIGYYDNSKPISKKIYICPHCKNPTAFIRGEDGRVRQYPGAVYGNEVENLPSSVASLYDEVRRCIQYTSYTSAVLAMRKLLMHVAVEQGAKENQKFIEYVNFLDENGWIPPSGKEWVDEIRKTGNEATHEIVLMDEDDAKQLLDFIEMLLKIIYEFPMKIRKK